MDVTLPDGTVIKGVPDGMSRADLTARLARNGYDVSKLAAPAAAAPADTDREQARRYIEEGNQRLRDQGRAAGQQEAADFVQSAKMAVPNAIAGTINGAGQIGSTILLQKDMADDLMAGRGLSLQSNRERRAKIKGGLQDAGAQPDSLPFKAASGVTQVAGTLGLGPAAGAASRSLGAPAALANSIATSGMRAGVAGPGLPTAAANMGTRMAGGGITGALSAGLANPDDAGWGAGIGMALPPILAAAGYTGKAIGGALRGARPTPEVANQIKNAREVGYVIPPTQAKPSMMNRTIEGFAGKLTTAQNASARNQNVTNELAKKAIGATDLSPAGLAEVRKQANAAYDQLGQAGAFQADNAFAAALDKAGSASAAMRANFPELANNQVDTLIQGLKSRPQFEAQPTIEAIKQFRADAATNKKALDPALVAMGRAQSKVAAALEDLVERNLTRSGEQGLLDGFRSARQVLAKTHDLEKAINPATGTVDAAKLAQALRKGKPLSGELKRIAEFASAFPKAVQTTERMGSLPGFSPLDFAALGTMSAATANPALMAGVMARPAVRSLALSNTVQNRLLPGQPGFLEQLVGDPRAQQLMYRAGPQQGGD